MMVQQVQEPILVLSVEPILLADTELAVMEADTDNSNCPLDNSESLAIYCTPNVQE